MTISSPCFRSIKSAAISKRTGAGLRQENSDYRAPTSRSKPFLAALRETAGAMSIIAAQRLLYIFQFPPDNAGPV